MEEEIYEYLKEDLLSFFPLLKEYYNKEIDLRIREVAISIYNNAKTPRYIKIEEMNALSLYYLSRRNTPLKRENLQRILENLYDKVFARLIFEYEEYKRLRESSPKDILISDPVLSLHGLIVKKFREMGINTLEDLLKYSPNYFNVIYLRGISEKKFTDLVDMIHNAGFKFAYEEEKEFTMDTYLYSIPLSLPVYRVFAKYNIKTVRDLLNHEKDIVTETMAGKSYFEEIVKLILRVKEELNILDDGESLVNPRFAFSFIITKYLVSSTLINIPKLLNSQINYLYGNINLGKNRTDFIIKRMHICGYTFKCETEEDMLDGISILSPIYIYPFSIEAFRVLFKLKVKTMGDLLNIVPLLSSKDIPSNILEELNMASETINNLIKINEEKNYLNLIKSGIIIDSRSDETIKM